VRLGDYDLRAGTEQKIELRFTSQPGVSKLRLATDTRAGIDANDNARPFAMRIDDLAYGAASAP
jgi:hypothetical protein